MRYIALLIICVVMCCLVYDASSAYQVSDEDGTRTITITDRQVVGVGSVGYNPTFMVKNAHDEWFIIDGPQGMDNIRMYNELKINSTHLVQLYYEYYIIDVIT